MIGPYNEACVRPGSGGDVGCSKEVVAFLRSRMVSKKRLEKNGRTRMLRSGVAEDMYVYVHASIMCMCVCMFVCMFLWVCVSNISCS